MLQFALAIFVLDLTGSALIFSTVLSAIIFPRIIGTPIAGYLADYKDCLRILKLGALGLTALMLSFFLIHTLITPLNISLIYVLVICLELCETLISASEMKAVICIVMRIRLLLQASYLLWMMGLLRYCLQLLQDLLMDYSEYKRYYWRL